MASSTGASALFLAPEFDLNDLFCSSAGSASVSNAAPSSTSFHPLHADPSTRPAKRDWFASILNVDDGSMDNINLSLQPPPPPPAPSTHLSFTELLQDSPYVSSGGIMHAGVEAAASDISQFLTNPNDGDEQEGAQREGGQRATYGAALRLSDVAAALGTEGESSGRTLIDPLLDKGSINVLQAGATAAGSPAGGPAWAAARPDAFPRGAGNLSYVDELIERAHSLQLPPFPVIGKAGLAGGKKKGSKKAAAPGKKGGGGRRIQSSTAQSLLLLQRQQREDHHDGDLMSAADLTLSDPKKIAKDPVVRREVHIHSERQRRKGMTHLYATLHSLLPEGKPKTDRCSVLTETMKYIRALRQQIEELGVQKAAMKSMPARPAPMLSSAPGSTTSTINITDKASSKAGVAAAINDHNPNNSINVHHADHDEATATAMVVEPSTDHTSASFTSSSSSRPAANSGADIYPSDQSAVGSLPADAPAAADVAVRFFGGDAFITLRTLKRKGIWSGVLKVLDDQNVDVLNVTLSAATADTDFHCIHAKVPANTSELRSYDLHRILKALVAAQPSRFEEAQRQV